MKDWNKTQLMKHGRNVDVFEEDFDFEGQHFSYLIYVFDGLRLNLFSEEGELVCTG